MTTSDAKYVKGFVCGCFDPFPHPGHLKMLEFASQMCTTLVVGLQIDPKLERPYKSRVWCTLAERKIMLQAIRWVDEIRVYATESDLVRLLIEENPDVRILGDDYRGKAYTGDDLDIPVFYANRSHGWSATDFRKRLGLSLS
jgi:glycerol-3-phosphate cytidylyltransferase